MVVNHFKSKGSGVDDGTGQGNANPDRVATGPRAGRFRRGQFATDRGTDALFLAGDFNSYTKEDPIQVLYSEGFKAIESDTPGEETYSFSGLSGSLDHVLGNRAAIDLVTGADIWDINSPESVAYQYGRYNYNVTDFFDATPPVRGLRPQPGDRRASTWPARHRADVQILATNDFHGRISPTTPTPRPAPPSSPVRSSSCVRRTRTPCSPPPVT